jgi:ubiquitin-large subunit ribosomal protein L40e
VLKKALIMGKFSLADENLANVMICRRCKSRNIMTAQKCRKCGYKYLRPKRKEKRVKK